MGDYYKVCKRLKLGREKLETFEDLKLLAIYYKLPKEVFKLDVKIDKMKIRINALSKELSNIIASEV